MTVGEIDSLIVILEDLDDRLTAAVDHLNEDPRDEFIAYVCGFVTTCQLAIRIALKACNQFHKENQRDLRVVKRSQE